MLFTLKKYIGGLMLPLPFLLLLIGTGIALVWFSRWQRTGKSIITVSWMVLFMISLQPVADGLLGPIENSYPTWRGEQRVNYIVVLGGGYTWNDEWAPSSNLINNSLPRLTEGIRLWRENPGARMIFTGAAARTNPVSTAEAGARVAESLGVPRSDILTLDSPKDTEEEAAAVKAAIGDAPFLLVTSASHMPRAVIFFRQAGLHPLPAPANQLAIHSPLNPWESAIPSPVWLMHSDRVGYETLGRVWQWLKGESGKPGQE
ncbi:envelope biogenesis factor ElyC [Yokenella regensburgei]|uniref:envelope biogenesis factor ElyC n=1 Tax=Yokenella regensburgei TaxID=158877 RepID=UPI003F146213